MDDLNASLAANSYLGLNASISGSKLVSTGILVATTFRFDWLSPGCPTIRTKTMALALFPHISSDDIRRAGKTGDESPNLYTTGQPRISTSCVLERRRLHSDCWTTCVLSTQSNISLPRQSSCIASLPMLYFLERKVSLSRSFALIGSTLVV